MSRELKRVALEFEWPLRKVWRGYVNPHYRECPEVNRTCFNGQTAAAAWLDSICRFLSLLGSEGAENTPERVAGMQKAGRTFPHPYLAEFPQAPTTSTPAHVLQEAFDIYPDSFHDRVRYTQTRSKHGIVVPEAGVTEMIRALAGFKEEIKPGIFGSEQELQCQLWRRLRRLMGAKKGWGDCPVCKGDNLDPAIREAHDAWKPEDPPAGDGWQLWETVSEGSPVSPVLPTREAFVAWLIADGATLQGAEAFATSGWVPSMVMDGKGNMTTGVDIAALAQNEEGR